MRGTVAKRLRRQARAATAGKPWSRLGIRKMRTPFGIISWRSHDPESGKYLYKRLKAAHKPQNS